MVSLFLVPRSSFLESLVLVPDSLPINPLPGTTEGRTLTADHIGSAGALDDLLDRLQHFKKLSGSADFVIFCTNSFNRGWTISSIKMVRSYVKWNLWLVST